MDLMEENPLDFLCKEEGMEKGRRNRICIKQSLTLNPFMRTMIDCTSAAVIFVAFMLWLCQWVNVWQEKHLVIKKLQTHDSRSKNH